jgi:hypothetical protein
MAASGRQEPEPAQRIAQPGRAAGSRGRPRAIDHADVPGLHGQRLAARQNQTKSRCRTPQTRRPAAGGGAVHGVAHLAQCAEQPAGDEHHGEQQHALIQPAGHAPAQARACLRWVSWGKGRGWAQQAPARTGMRRRSVNSSAIRKAQLAGGPSRRSSGQRPALAAGGIVWPTWLGGRVIGRVRRGRSRFLVAVRRRGLLGRHRASFCGGTGLTAAARHAALGLGRSAASRALFLGGSAW